MDQSAKQFPRPSARWQARLPSRASRLAGAFALMFSCVATVHSAERLELKRDDIVAFVGGADVAAAQHTGHLEALLTVARPGVRFRNFGWEGDTVFAQPRDYNFPPLVEHLRTAKASVVFVQFGRTEVFNEPALKGFRPAYEALLKDFSSVTPQLVLVTPIPFEKADAPLPDLSARNDELKEIAAIIREIGNDRSLPVVDLFEALSKHEQRLTDDGLQLTGTGQARVANAFAAELGLSPFKWPSPMHEKLRRLVVEKNRLWFNYWRPQNWAFLGGDRISQPSSRDHRDPKVRWFPAEMEKFLGLIAEKEDVITRLARER